MTQADDHQVPLDVVSVQLGEDACTATHVYRDAAGEMVRMPALQIVADTGCTCQACKHTWLTPGALAGAEQGDYRSADGDPTSGATNGRRVGG
jgi:hypothetical protein